MKTHRRFFAALVAVLLLLAGTTLLHASGSGRGGGDDDGGGGGTGGGDKGLVLRVNSTGGAPGGIVGVVVRTYAPRPIRQGQIQVKVVRRPQKPAKLGLGLEELTQPVRPFLTLLSAVVYSPRNDSLAQAALTGRADSQLAKVIFQSPSGSINSVDGPLALLRFRLDPSLQPGQTFDLSIDPAETGLTDEQGRPITVTPRSGVLTVKVKKAG